jgi:hypothetical protein
MEKIIKVMQKIIKVMEKIIKKIIKVMEKIIKKIIKLMQKKLYIILISILLNLGLKNPMLFFFNQLGMPYSVYLIWVGLSSCLLAFVVFNLKNSNSKDKLTFLNYLYIFAVSIIFICIFNTLVGYLYLDLFISLAAAFSMSIWWGDFFFKSWATKFDFNDFFKPKAYLGGNEGLSSSTSIIKWIEPDLNNYKKGSVESPVSDNESSDRPISTASNHNNSDSESESIRDSSSGDIFDKFNKFEESIKKAQAQFADLRQEIEKSQASSSLVEEKPKLPEPEPEPKPKPESEHNSDMNIKSLGSEIIIKTNALSDKHVKLLTLKLEVYDNETCRNITGNDPIIEKKILELLNMGRKAQENTYSIILKGQGQYSYQVVNACVEEQLKFCNQSTKLANEIFSTYVEKVQKANPDKFKDINKQVFQPVTEKWGNSQKELKIFKSEILKELAKLKKC